VELLLLLFSSAVTKGLSSVSTWSVSASSSLAAGIGLEGGLASSPPE
jgi:hypothetical protein